MEMCLGARAGSHEMAEMTGQTRRVDEELGGTGMNAVREPWEAAGKHGCCSCGFLLLLIRKAAANLGVIH